MTTREEILKILKDVCEEPDDIEEIDVLTTYRAGVLINQLLTLIGREKEEARQEVFDEWGEEKRKLLEGFGYKKKENKEVLVTKDCNCGWHDNIGMDGGESCGFFQPCCRDCPTYKVAHPEEEK